MDLDLTQPWMMFVDGENFTLRGEAFLKNNQIPLVEGPHFSPKVRMWVPGLLPFDVLYAATGRPRNATVPIRAYYYTSVVGDENIIRGHQEALRESGFQAEVFKKPKRSEKSKGVDITLAKDLLVHTFSKTFSFALLVAGDGDFVPLIDEVKRQGRVVVVAFFERDGLNPDLRLEADHFVSLDRVVFDAWSDYSLPVLGTTNIGTADGPTEVRWRGRRETAEETPTKPETLEFESKPGILRMKPPEGFHPDLERRDLLLLYNQLAQKQPFIKHGPVE